MDVGLDMEVSRKHRTSGPLGGGPCPALPNCSVGFACVQEQEGRYELDLGKEQPQSRGLLEYPEPQEFRIIEVRRSFRIWSRYSRA